MRFTILRRLASILKLVAVVAIIGCGGAGADDPDSGPADPQAVLACLEDEGLDASSQNVPGPTGSGETTVIIVDVTRNEGITLSFFAAAEDAQAYADTENEAAAAGLNASSTELVDPTTALRAAGDVDAEREIVDGCL